MIFLFVNIFYKMNTLLIVIIIAVLVLVGLYYYKSQQEGFEIFGQEMTFGSLSSYCSSILSLLILSFMTVIVYKKMNK